MIVIDNNPFAAEDILFTFALASEAAEVFNGQRKLITGIGKVNATYQLTKAIAEKKPKLIVNLGSAGSNSFAKGEIVCCTSFIQRDMDVQGLGYHKYETPFSDMPSVLKYGLQLTGLKTATCGTGDNFEMGHISLDYTVVDMEAYALAVVAMQEDIPFLCLKYISDGADDNAAEDWLVQVHKAAIAYGHIFGLVKGDVLIP